VALTGILFLFSAHLFATPIDTRQYQWKRIRTEFHDVIFPDSLEEEGRYVSSALQFMLPRQMPSLQLSRPKRYPVVPSPDSMPLVYPDLALESILYIPGISLDPFLDYAYALDIGVSGSSAGADLLMHFHALQLPFRLTSGLRFAWLLETREPVVQFLMMGMAF
jgi:hypothetical protein